MIEDGDYDAVVSDRRSHARETGRTSAYHDVAISERLEAYRDIVVELVAVDAD